MDLPSWKLHLRSKSRFYGQNKDQLVNIFRIWKKWSSLFFNDINGILALLEIWEGNQLDNVRKLFRDDETTDCERSRSPVINSGYKNGRNLSIFLWTSLYGGSGVTNGVRTFKQGFIQGYII